MLDVAIVGGGLCGLALAHSLQARGVEWSLVEARTRLGGRVLTQRAANGLALDLGPAWFWPATQPSITRVVADLGLATFAQPDDGRVLLLDDPNRAPRALSFDAASGRLFEDAAVARPGAVHGGAHRLAEGMQALIDAFAARLPHSRLRLGAELVAVADRGDHVELHIGSADAPAHLLARRVVFALPPRLVAERIRFAPQLPPALQAALAATPTWMATAAKAALTTVRPVWREQGLAGNAWVQHAQAVLAEVFDAGNARSDVGALAGFAAQPLTQRRMFRASMPLLVDSQVTMLFGEAAAPLEQHWQDWAEEPFTCSEADRAEADLGAAHSTGDARLREPAWAGRLWFGGSETAAAHAGYLEGALSAAARLRRQLTQAPALA